MESTWLPDYLAPDTYIFKPEHDAKSTACGFWFSNITMGQILNSQLKRVNLIRPESRSYFGHKGHFSDFKTYLSAPAVDSHSLPVRLKTTFKFN